MEPAREGDPRNMSFPAKSRQMDSAQVYLRRLSGQNNPEMTEMTTFRHVPGNTDIEHLAETGRKFRRA